LSKSAESIKRTSLNIKNMMVDDEALVSEVDKGLVKNQTLLKQTMDR
jgi:predicted DNA-binding ArsR family transcriptional regulator